MKIRPYQDSDEESLIQLWTECGLVAPQNNPIRDIERKLEVNPEWFLIGVESDKVVASFVSPFAVVSSW